MNNKSLAKNENKRPINISSLSDIEASIMEIVWEKEPITVREVHEILLKNELDKKDKDYIPYTTVMSVMNKLAQNGLLKQDKSSKVYQYSSLVDRQELSKNMIKSIAEKLLDKSASSMVTKFLSSDDNISLEKIKKIFDSLKK